MALPEYSSTYRCSYAWGHVAIAEMLVLGDRDKLGISKKQITSYNITAPVCHHVRPNNTIMIYVNRAINALTQHIFNPSVDRF